MDDDGSELFKSCMLTVLAAITCNNDNLNSGMFNKISVCGIVLQHEGFMEVLQKCIDKQYGCIMFNISCDILTILVWTKNVKTCRSVIVDISTLVDVITLRDQEMMVAGMKLLTAIFYTDLTSCAVNISGRIYPNTFRTLYIHLQQICMQDVREYASNAVQCMKELISHLYRSDTEQYLGDELLSQPWNKALIEIILDLALCGSLYSHHLNLFSFFLGTVQGCIVMKTIPHITDKLLQLVRMDVFNEDGEMKESCNEMMRVPLYVTIDLKIIDYS
ncbi:Meiosis inhibitor [Mactra antiquata]